MRRYTVNPDAVYDSEVYETADEFLERIRNKNIRHYTVQIIPSGEWAEVKIFPEWKKRQFVPKKEGKSPQAMQRLNHRNAVDKLTRLLNHNFKCYEDMFCTFTFDNDHLVLTEEEGFEQAQKAINRMKYQFKKAGVKMTAVYKVEIKKAKDSHSRYIKTSDGLQLLRPHLHMVVKKGIEIQKLEKAWGVGKNKRIELLRYNPEGFLKLATYLCKDTKKGHRRWSATTNLIKPPPAKNIYTSKAGSKKKVSEIAVNENLHKEYFEQILPEYYFVQSVTKMSDLSSGAYIHCRMAKKQERKY